MNQEINDAIDAIKVNLDKLHSELSKQTLEGIRREGAITRAELSGQDCVAQREDMYNLKSEISDIRKQMRKLLTQWADAFQ